MQESKLRERLVGVELVRVLDRELIVVLIHIDSMASKNKKMKKISHHLVLRSMGKDVQYLVIPILETTDLHNSNTKN